MQLHAPLFAFSCINIYIYSARQRKLQLPTRCCMYNMQNFIHLYIYYNGYNVVYYLCGSNIGSKFICKNHDFIFICINATDSITNVWATLDIRIFFEILFLISCGAIRTTFFFFTQIYVVYTNLGCLWTYCII